MGMILDKTFSDFYTDCSTKKFTSFKRLTCKADSTTIKYSSQGSLTVKIRTVDKLSFLLKTIYIYKQKASKIIAEIMKESVSVRLIIPRTCKENTLPFTDLIYSLSQNYESRAFRIN